MSASEAAAEAVVEAGKRCSLTKSVLREWAGKGTPRQVESLLGVFANVGVDGTLSRFSTLRSWAC